MEVFSYHKGEGGPGGLCGPPPWSRGGPGGLRGPPKEPQGLRVHPQNWEGPHGLHMHPQSTGELG